MKKTLLVTLLLSSVSILNAKTIESEYVFKHNETNTPQYKLFETVDTMKVVKSKTSKKVSCWVEFERDGKIYSTNKVDSSEVKVKRNPVKACLDNAVANSFL